MLSRNYGVEIEHFLIRKGGVKGYSRALIQLYNYTKTNKVDLIHVHYGIWALIPVITKYAFFRKYKIVVTFHGSDINRENERKLSLAGAQFSSYNILVSDKMLPYFDKGYSVIPCGIDTDVQLGFRDVTRKEKGWNEDDFVVLFSSSFSRKDKDPDFAFSVIDAFSKVTTKSVKFLELKGYTREQLTHLMQAADALIMCSQTEGSPQVIKEAILNSLPVVSNNVGDVQDICSGVDNCYVVEKKVEAYVQCLQRLAQNNLRVQNRKPVIDKFDNNKICEKIYGIYSKVLDMKLSPIQKPSFSHS